jgi:hypothetical protein
MAVWNTPITWANGAITASQMNSLRDNLVWLKGFADNITDSTAADSGAGTRLAITRAGATDAAFEAKVSGDSQPRIRIRAGGSIYMSENGSSTPVQVMDFVNGYLQFPRIIAADDFIRLLVLPGTINDLDVPGYFSGAKSGLMAVDSTNRRLYINVLGTWRYVALV